MKWSCLHLYNLYSIKNIQALVFIRKIGIQSFYFKPPCQEIRVHRTVLKRGRFPSSNPLKWNMQRHLLCDDLIGCYCSQSESNRHFMSANDIVQILNFAFTAALLNYIPLTGVHGRKSFQSSVDILDSRSVKTIRPILSFFLYKLLDYVNLIKIKVDHQK